MRDEELEKAEADLEQAESKLEAAQATERTAEHEIEEAVQEIREAEEHHHHPETVEIKVDRVSKQVAPGVYIVSAFKVLVGVAADRELDILQDGALRPLADDAEIKICAHEVFVSHARTGGSS